MRVYLVTEIYRDSFGDLRTKKLPVMLSNYMAAQALADLRCKVKGIEHAFVVGVDCADTVEDALEILQKD